jgi:methyl-accepting chemotaxis protein
VNIKKSIPSFSLRNILILLIILIVVIPNVFIFLIIYNNVSGALHNSLDDNATNSVRLLNENITQFISQKSFTIDKLSHQLSGDFSQKTHYQDLLNNVNESDQTSAALTYGNNAGQYVRSPATKLTNDIRKEQWYKLAMAHPGKVVITSPFVSTLTNKVTIILAKTTLDNRGVISMDVNLDSLNKMTHQVVVGDHGYAFLLDKDGEWIYNPKANTGTLANSQIINLTSKSSEGSFDSKSNGTNDRVFYMKNALTGWKIGGVMKVSEINKTLNPLIYKLSLLICLFLVVIITLAMLFIIFKIIRPLDKFVYLFSKISSGDLTHKVGKEIKVNKEFTNLATNMNHMIDFLRTMIENIDQKAEILAASSEELTASTEENKATSDEIAHSINEIAIGSESQSENVSDTSRHAEKINEEIKVITNKTSLLGNTADQAAGTVNTGTQSLEKVTEQMKLIKSKSGIAAASLNELTNHVKEIETMNSLINEIAEQTNLLSLNAAIEAARAGEDGKGFAVVADEIRKLAQQSQKSSQQITKVVTNIQEKTAHAVESMNGGIEEVGKGIHVVNEAGHSFESIQQAVETVTKEINNVTESVHSIFRETESTVASFETITHLAEKAINNSDNVAAAAEEQSAAMEEVAQNAAALSKIADELHQLVDTFKTRE